MEHRWHPAGIAGVEGTVKVWEVDVVEDREAESQFLGHGPNVRWVGWTSRANVIASSGTDKTVRLWKLGGSDRGARILSSGSNVRGLSWSPDGERFVTVERGAGRTGVLRTWNSRTGEVREEASRGAGRRVAWSPDGTRLATGGADPFTVVICDARSLEPTATLTRPAPAGDPDAAVMPPVGRLAWSPDGSRLASGSFYGATIWDIETGDVVRTVHPPHNGRWARALSWSPDGRRVAVGFRGPPHEVRVYDTETFVTVWHRRRPWVGFSYVEAAAWSPDGKLLATGDPDRSIRIWNAASGSQVAVLRGHLSDVESLSWSPDSTRLASASGDGTVRLWDPNLEADVLVLDADVRGANAVAWNPDGVRLAAGGAGGTVTIWDASHGYRWTRFPVSQPLSIGASNGTRTISRLWSSAPRSSSTRVNGSEPRGT